MTGKDAQGSWRGIVFRTVLLIGVSAALGLAVNVGHVVKYFRGEYGMVFAEAAAAEDPPLIALAEAADLFAVGQAVFVDARSPEEYEAGHIAGALNVPLYDPASDMIWESLAVSQEADVVVYCSADLCQDSLVLARRLSRLGWRKAKVYVGGWLEWRDAGLPAEMGR